MANVAEGSTKHDNICREAFKEYEGSNVCAYNIAKAFLQTKEFLEKEISRNSANWMWRNVHHNEYLNIPWSRTPLKFIFHREIPTFGNMNTPHVSKYGFKRASETRRFKSTHVAAYKHLVQLD